MASLCEHYEKTSNAWLARMDKNRNEALSVLASTYGDAQAQRWLQR